MKQINDNCNAQERFELIKEAKKLNKRIVKRMVETGGRYANIQAPKAGWTNHHIIPYGICINKRNNAESFEDFDYWENLACSDDNIISLPYPAHKELHRRLKDNGFDFTKYVQDDKLKDLKKLTIELVSELGYENEIEHLL